MLADQREIVVVLTTLPDTAAALALARLLVEQRLAACVNVLAACTSVYRWQGALENATEVPLLIKAAAASYADLEAGIRANHPYGLPEIVRIPATGLPAYLDWVCAQSAPRQ